MRVTLRPAAEEQSQGKAEIVIEMQPRSYRWRRGRVVISIPLYQEQRPSSEPQRNSPQHIRLYRSSLYIAGAERVTRAALTGHEIPTTTARRISGGNLSQRGARGHSPVGYEITSCSPREGRPYLSASWQGGMLNAVGAAIGTVGRCACSTLTGQDVWSGALGAHG